MQKPLLASPNSRKKTAPRMSALRYGAADARLDAILEQTVSAGFLTIAGLADALGVSEMTVRRDVGRLAKDGKVRLVHGGVCPADSALLSAFARRCDLNRTAKEAIATTAAALVGFEDSVALDAGSTALQVMERLAPSFVGCIVTHSVPVIQSAIEQQRFRVIMLGGDLLRESAALVGPLSVEAAAKMRVRIFFLGAAAIDERGIYGAADIERPTKRALIEAADQVVLLADHTKFSRSAPVLLCSLDAVDVLITDQTPPPHITAALHKADVNVRIAGQED